MKGRLAALMTATLLGVASFSSAQAQPMPGGGWWGRGMMGGWMRGGWARHHEAMMNGVPAPYASTANPLPATEDTLRHGAEIYAQNCVTCHGENGHGDGPAAADLSPPPADLAWLAAMPMAQWDAYMNWTVSEGGAPFGSAMPAFKETLSQDEIWAVISYVQNQLPSEAR